MSDVSDVGAPDDRGSDVTINDGSDSHSTMSEESGTGGGEIVPAPHGPGGVIAPAGLGPGGPIAPPGPGCAIVFCTGRSNGRRRQSLHDSIWRASAVRRLPVGRSLSQHCCTWQCLPTDSFFGSERKGSV